MVFDAISFVLTVDEGEGMKSPFCHWPDCSASNREMYLLSESDTFWFFAHGCGTTRAVSKPLARERAAYENAQRDAASIRRRQAQSKVVYSIPSHLGRR